MHTNPYLNIFVIYISGTCMHNIILYTSCCLPFGNKNEKKKTLFRRYSHFSPQNYLLINSETYRTA